MNNVINIDTRRPDSFKSSTLDMANQLVATEGVVEIVRVLACIGHDFRETSPVYQRDVNEITDDFRSEMWDILSEAAARLDDLEDRHFGPPI